MTIFHFTGNFSGGPSLFNFDFITICSRAPVNRIPNSFKRMEWGQQLRLCKKCAELAGGEDTSRSKHAQVNHVSSTRRGQQTKPQPHLQGSFRCKHLQCLMEIRACAVLCRILALASPKCVLFYYHRFGINRVA